MAVREMRWQGKQSEALLDTTRYLDIEGGIRASKTTIGLWKVMNACLAHPGMKWLVCRWSDDDVRTLLKPLLVEMFEQCGLAAPWVADEHRFTLPNQSWIYVRGLRPGQGTSRFSKLRGLTLGGVYLDQAEEVEEDYFLELKGRLSQTGVPCQLILTPNPPGEDHWLAQHFPDTGSGAPTKEAHRLITLSLFDNQHNLEPGYVAQLLEDYPEGHPMRRRLIEGKRGLATHGTPVYQGYFVRARHAQAATLNPHVPLIEALDFGHHHPCALWVQYLPWGAVQWLGGLMGEDLFLEDFVPILLQTRAEWFPEAREVWTCGDPAGAHGNAGVKRTAMTVLEEHGLSPRWVETANTPEVRAYAIQSLGGYMRRITAQGEAFRVDPHRWRVVGKHGARFLPFGCDGLEAGYVWDPSPRRAASGALVTVPQKDGWYDHVQNCGEYAQVTYGPARQTGQATERLQRAYDRATTRRDVDPADRYRRVAAGATMGRGGW